MLYSLLKEPGTAVNRRGEDMEKLKLTKNGIKIYSYENPSQHGFFISLFLRAGSMFETANNNGITHFFEHIAIRNVNKAMGGSLYSELDRRGVEFNASTYSEMVQFYISGAVDKFAFGADVITKIFSPIILGTAEIEIERKRIKAEIREADDKTSLTAFANGIVHRGTSLALPITGTLTGVDKINARRLEEYRRRLFTSDNIFFYITGNVTEADLDYLASLIEKSEISSSGEHNRNEAPVTAAHFARAPEIHVKNSPMTSVRFTFDIDMTRTSTPETDLIYDMLFSGYNSKFFMEMSEKRGLLYDLSGTVERYTNIGELCFSYDVRAKELESSVRLAVDILKEFKKTRHATEDMMKCAYVDNAELLYDDMRELNFTFAYDNHIMQLGYPSLEARVAAYAAVRGEDIMRAAGEIFKRENLTLAIKGDKKKINTREIEKILSFL